MNDITQFNTNSQLYLHGLTTVEQIEALYNKFSKHLETTSDLILTINLKDVSFIRPAGIVALVSIARTWFRLKQGYVLIVDIQQPVYAYLERMNLFSEFSAYIKVSPHFVPTELYSRSDNSKSLLEIFRLPNEELENAKLANDVIRRTNQILRDKYGFNANVHRLCTIFLEVLSNIVHSNDEGYALIQSYRDNPETGRRVELAVGDLGIGIRASLLSNQLIVDQVDSLSLVKGSDFILHSLKEGVSSRADWSYNGRGLGLSLVSQKVGQWEQGLLRIRSGNSLVELTQYKERPNCINDLAFIPGTQVTISVSAKPFGSN